MRMAHNLTKYEEKKKMNESSVRKIVKERNIRNIEWF